MQDKIFKPLTILIFILIPQFGYSQETYKDILETEYVPIDQEPNAKSKPSKFIMVWEKQDEEWLISKVISLH